MNKSVDLEKTIRSAHESIPPALLFEMIRSFVSLAATLNLSHSVKQLGSTRQTVRRHISTLEEAMNAPLFSVNDRQYTLTDAGRNALPGAEDILARGITWLRGQSRSIGSLQHLRADHGDWTFTKNNNPLAAFGLISRCCCAKLFERGQCLLERSRTRCLNMFGPF